MFKKGQSGNPSGQWAEKPFREALRMELAAAGIDHKALRRIARALIAKAGEGEIAAIKEVADRMDGKPAQEATVTVQNKRDATDWTRAELVAILDDARARGRGDDTPAGREPGSDRIH